MENLLIKGIITNTSKKSGEFNSKTKTAYVEVEEYYAEQLKDLGLTEYKSKENDTKFFIIKLVERLMVYDKKQKNQRTERTDLSSLETENFEIETPIFMNIIKGKNKGNDFYRIQALRVNSMEDIKKVAPENPFANLEDDDENLPF